MIRFLSKMRRQLAGDNKPLKYLRYAMGEILLVVIGILIALNINNWNEERKTRAEMVEYLKNIKVDILSDTLALKDKEVRIASWEHRIGDYFAYYDNREWTIQQIVDSCKHTGFELWVYIPINNTYLDMLSSGKTNLLNDDIRGDLFELKKMQDAFIQIGESINSVITNNIHEVEKYWDMENTQYFKKSISRYRAPVAFYDINNPDGYPDTNTDQNLILGLKFHHNIYNWMYHYNDMNTTVGDAIILKSRDIIKLINAELEK